MPAFGIPKKDKEQQIVEDLRLLALKTSLSEGGENLLNHYLPILRESVIKQMTGTVVPTSDELFYLTGQLRIVEDIRRMIHMDRKRVDKPLTGGLPINVL